MKHIILIAGIIICLLAAHVVLAQSEGVILYDTKVNLHKTLPPDRAEMKEMIPEFNVHKNKLAFRNAESLYVNIDEEEEEDFGQDSGPVQVRMRRPMNEHYFDFAKRKKVTMQEFLGKHFLIEDSIRSIPWKMATDTKIILGYQCHKATWLNAERKQNITVWYAANLPPFLGPETFSSLPGTILEVDINEGERTITATKIEFRPLEKKELVVPTKGEKTTAEAFQKLVEEQRRRMGGNGNIIIRN